MISAVAPFPFAAVRRGCLEISVVVDNGELVCGGVDRSQPVIQRRADATEYDRIEYGGLPVKWALLQRMHDVAASAPTSARRPRWALDQRSWGSRREDYVARPLPSGTAMDGARGAITP
jgi:hypothetical protein